MSQQFIAQVSNENEGRVRKASRTVVLAPRRRPRCGFVAHFSHRPRTRAPTCPACVMTEHERARQVEAAQRLFAVRKTVSEMLQARGYVVSERELNETFDDFTAQFGDTPKRAALFRLAKKRDESDTCLVFMPENEKVGAKDVEEYAPVWPEMSRNDGVLATGNSVRARGRPAASSLSRTPLRPLPKLCVFVLFLRNICFAVFLRYDV